jgi:hypothetical protein
VSNSSSRASEPQPDGDSGREPGPAEPDPDRESPCAGVAPVTDPGEGDDDGEADEYMPL